MKKKLKDKKVTTPVRTPEVLGPLIEQDLLKAEKAGLQYYLAAGAKLNEARETIKGDREWGRFRMRWCPYLEPEQCERYQRAARRYAGIPATLSKLSGDMRDSHQKKAEAVIAEVDAEIAAEWDAGFIKAHENNRRSEAEINRPLTAEEQAEYEEEKAQTKRFREQFRAQEKARETSEKELRDFAEKIIVAGYRALSKKYHPDHSGGDGAVFVKLTDARDWALAQLNEHGFDLSDFLRRKSA